MPSATNRPQIASELLLRCEAISLAKDAMGIGFAEDVAGGRSAIQPELSALGRLLGLGCSNNAVYVVAESDWQRVVKGDALVKNGLLVHCGSWLGLLRGFCGQQLAGASGMTVALKGVPHSVDADAVLLSNLCQGHPGAQSTEELGGVALEVRTTPPGIGHAKKSAGRRYVGGVPPQHLRNLFVALALRDPLTQFCLGRGSLHCGSL
jgi:hypothetical protein